MVTEQALLFIGIAILCAAGKRVLHRYVAKETDPYCYAFLESALSAAIFLLFALTSFSLPKNTEAWIVLIVAGVLWACVGIAGFIAYKGTEVSLREPVSQSKLIWIFLLGTLFLGEVITVLRGIGTLLIFLGITALLWHPERKFGRLSDPGVKWTLLTAILAAAVAAVDKYALNWFQPEVYAFFVYLLPVIFLAPRMHYRKHHFKKLLKHRGFAAVAAILLAATTYYFTLKAYTVAEITLIYPLLQLSTLLTVIGGIFLLREREHFWQKIIATAIVVTGAILVGM